MLFNSLDFFIFLPIVFCLYWFVVNKNLKLQNVLLLVASYLFYGWWDYRFLSLILLSTLVDYFVGLKIYNSEKPKTKSRWLWLSIYFNLGILGFFKYFNFFMLFILNLVFCLPYFIFCLLQIKPYKTNSILTSLRA